jgi:alpha-tubulin suppressor-like RCC1 family protein
MVRRSRRVHTVHSLASVVEFLMVFVGTVVRWSYTPRRPATSARKVTLRMLVALAGCSATAGLVCCPATAQVTGPPLVEGAAATPGPLMAWGSNSNGDFGNQTIAPTNTATTTPVAGPANHDFAAVDHGNDFTLGIDGNETLWAWGSNVDWQLGQGGTGTVGSDVPEQVNWNTPSTPPTAIAAGSDWALALDSSGYAWAWGLNASGQLGDGNNTTNLSAPTTKVETAASTPLTNVTAISAGGSYGLALRSDGTAWAWGIGTNGQLGNGTTTSSNYAVEVETGASTPLTNIVAVAAGGGQGLALRSDGTVWAWGTNTYGELGNGTTTNSSYAVEVDTAASTPLNNIVGIATGSGHSVAVSETGAVFSWGENNDGQLGNGTTTNSAYAVQASGLSGQDVVSVSGGGYGSYYSMALTASGQVWDWGYNGSGQLGNGTTTNSSVPVQVTAVGNGAAAIVAGGSTSMIIGQPAVSAGPASLSFSPQKIGGASSSLQVKVTNTGVAPVILFNALLVGQDADSFGVSGDSCSGTTLAVGASCTVGLRESPVAAGPLAAQLQITSNLPSQYTYVAVSGAGLPNSTSGLSFSTAAAQAFAAGSDSNGQLGAGNIGASLLSTPAGVRPASQSFVAVSAGGTHSLGLRSDGTVWSWGADGSGQLGNNSSSSDAWSPVQVPTEAGIIGISAGGSHSLAVGSDGTVWSWGSNSYGQLGYSTSSSQSGVPSEVPGLPASIVQVSAGASHSLALQANGTVWAWGLNSSGQLGNGNTTNSTAPVQVTGLPSGIVAISAGGAQSLALASNGTVWAWGLNSSGQLGNGSTTSSDTAVEVSGISTAVGIAAGNAHSLALLANGSVDAWGLNSSGQLGNGSTTSSDTPVAVSSLSGVTQIAAGYAHSVAITTSGQAYAWGANAGGQLGNGNTTQQTTPVQLTTVGNGAAALGVGSQANHTLIIGQSYAQPSATTLVFPSESPGQDSSALTETITNSGLTPLQITADQIVGADGDQFKITGDSCVGTTITAGNTCTIGVRYEALVTGTPAATLRITSNSPTATSLITLDPPAAKPPVSRRLTCRAIRMGGRSVVLSCTSKPNLPARGVATVWLKRGRTVLARGTGHILDRRLRARLSVARSAQSHRYTVVVAGLPGTVRCRVTFR